LTYKARAYAKVNLHLEVLNKRSDSYHNIFSLNASLDLFDRLTFKRLNISNNKLKDIVIDIRPDGGEYADIIQSIATEDNLITKAVKTYLNRIGKSGEFLIHIEKNIPAGAGLGGGSSDAAAALRLLNNFFIKSNEGLLETELLWLGASLGADIPYCLSGGFAICEGIGDIVNKVDGKLNYWILAANCGIIVNTGKAYNALKRDSKIIIGETELEKKKKLFKEGIKKGNIENFKDILKNDFEEPVFSEHNILKNLKNEIGEFKPEYVTMTGSGSTIIGIFKDKRNIEKALERLSKKAKVIITKFL